MSRMRWLGVIAVAALVVFMATASCLKTVLAQDAAGGARTKPAMMAKDTDPDWDVVTVKPSDPNDPHAGFNTEGREVTVERQTVEGMLLFGCGMHKRQLVNAPDWLATDRWDVRGVPDVPGQPSLKQMQTLVCKVLAERFGLVSHREQREVDVYALRVGKGGPKMEKSRGDPNGLPSENDNENGGEISMQMANASMGELTLLLKFMMDRPAVDQTGLSGRYDFKLKWTSDESRVPTDGSAPPAIFTAIQEQLGLKLEPVKTMTDVMVIDKIEKSTPN
jgi:uncharacterized protein (TIGR03435 family)